MCEAGNSRLCCRCESARATLLDLTGSTGFGAAYSCIVEVALVGFVDVERHGIVGKVRIVRPGSK